MVPLSPRTSRMLQALARAAGGRRAASVRVHDDSRLRPPATASILGFAFRGGRWLVTVLWHDVGGLCVIDVQRVASVRRSRLPAMPCPETFDPVAFWGGELLGWGVSPQRAYFLRPQGSWRRLTPVLLPTSTVSGVRAGAPLFRLDAAHSDVVLDLVRSVRIPAAVCSAPPMPLKRTKPQADSAAVRCLRLVSWLLSQQEPVTRGQIFAAFPDEYAGSSEASERKFTRDKDALRRLGYSLQTLDIGRNEEAVGYLVEARACALPAIELTPDEAALLWTASVTALRLSDHPLRGDLESAVRKLVVGGKGLPPRASDGTELDGGGEAATSTQLEQLIDAWERRKRLTVGYWRLASAEVVTRDVDVYGWAMRRGEWIFVGYCHLRKAVRIFYLSRVRALKVNAVRKQEADYDVPSDFDIRPWSRQQPWDYHVHAPLQATIRLRGSLAKVARQLLPAAKPTIEPSGARLATIQVSNLRALVRQALAWGPEAELVEPAEGRAMAREMLQPLAQAAAEVPP